MAILAKLLLKFGLEASEHMVCFERLGVRRIEVYKQDYFAPVQSQVDEAPSQELQDVTDADVEGLGLKAVAKNRMLRLLSEQKVRSIAAVLPFNHNKCKLATHPEAILS